MLRIKATLTICKFRSVDYRPASDGFIRPELECSHHWANLSLLDFIKKLQLLSSGHVAALWRDSDFTIDLAVSNGIPYRIR